MVASSKAFGPPAAVGELSESDLFAALEFSSRSGVSARHISRTSAHRPDAVGANASGGNTTPSYPASTTTLGRASPQPSTSNDGQPAGMPASCAATATAPAALPTAPNASGAAVSSQVEGGQTQTQGDEAASKVLTRLALHTNCHREVADASVATATQSSTAHLLLGRPRHRAARRSHSLHHLLEETRGSATSNKHARLAAMTLQAAIPERSSASNSSVRSFGGASISFRRQTCDGDHSEVDVHDPPPPLRTAFSAASASSGASSTHRCSAAGDVGPNSLPSLPFVPEQPLEGDFDLV
jgi:hypothetical protein